MSALNTEVSLEGFRPKFLSDLIRLGSERDGGYVLNERSVRLSRYLLSFGVNDDWSFELDFLSRNPNVMALCFDHSVSKSVFARNAANALNEVLSLKFLVLVLSLKLTAAWLQLQTLKYWTKIYLGFSRFLARENVRFHAKGVSSERSAEFVTFAEAFRLIPLTQPPSNSVFVKMDIEQSEFRVLPDLLDFEDYINGFVVEFHDLDILWPKFVELTRTLRSHFEITHIHGNNFGGLIPGSKTPKVLEITFLKRSLIDEQQTLEPPQSYPLPLLDRANDRSRADYPLVF